MDDTFLVFHEEDHATKFLNYLNSKHNNISFSADFEVDGQLSFLDVTVKKESDHFSTSIYRKKIFSGLYTNYLANIPMHYKFGLIYTLVCRVFRLCTVLGRSPS